MARQGKSRQIGVRAMEEPKRVVIIGGVACGPKTAARLRRLDPEAEITLIDKGRSSLTVPAGCRTTCPETWNGSMRCSRRRGA